MKNKRLIILLILLVAAVAIFFINKFGDKILPIRLNVDKIETIEIFYDKPMIIEDVTQHEKLIDYVEYIETIKVDFDGEAFNDIPVYRYENILNIGTSACNIIVGRDNGYYKGLSGRVVNSTVRILATFPSNAIRESEDKNYVYAVYDTAFGKRIYLFFSKEKNYSRIDGFPIIMSKVLEYKDFVDINIGDLSSEVESIDPITPLHTQLWDSVEDDMISARIEKDRGPTSVHLLKDGILKIEYKRIESGEYEIIDIVYREDFILSGLDGDTCYKIAECDYPSEKYERSSIILNSKDNVEAIAEIAAIFNESIKHPEQGIGTTHPTSVTIKYNNGKKTSFSCGVGNFITVARGKRQYNYINSELDEYIAQIISDWQ